MARLFRLDRALIRVAGPEAHDFLHNLLTQSVAPLPAPRYAALLNPQGKVIADVILWPEANGVVLEASVERGADLVRRLTMYKLRAQVSVSDASDALGIVWSEAPFDNAAADPRFPDGRLGYRRPAPIEETSDLPNGAAPFDALRIAIGVPDLARDALGEEV
ncbi:MAG: folate-binding protein, partial [Proteobacteria bacterium]|nr:folate-binding protein [Pseudomonadota bacterium]